MALKFNLTYGDETFTFDDIGGRVQSLTIKCEGKLMNDDIVIEMVEVVEEEPKKGYTLTAISKSNFNGYTTHSYLKFNSKPTSRYDYDFSTNDVYEDGVVFTFENVESYYHWQWYPYNEADNYKEIVLTADTTIYVNHTFNGSSD